MYARGILFGKMKYELGDHSFVRCPELDLTADIDFKTKGWVGGTYNAIGGVIKRESTGEVLYELSGLWSEEMYIKDMTVSWLRSPRNECFFLADVGKCRRDTETCSLMPTSQNLAHLWHDPLKNRKSGNLRDYGRRLSKPSRSATTSWQRTKRQRLKIGNVKKPLQGPMIMLSGFHDSSAPSTAGQENQRKAKRTWNG